MESKKFFSEIILYIMLILLILALEVSFKFVFKGKTKADKQGFFVMCEHPLKKHKVYEVSKETAKNGIKILGNYFIFKDLKDRSVRAYNCNIEF